MKMTIFLFAIVSHFIGHSQNIKTYNGKYKGGLAAYTYFENKDLKRIFDGKFNFKNGHSTITGNFSNNKKVGLWTYVYNWQNKYVKLVGDYNNNLKTGNWKYDEIITEGKKKKNFSTSFDFHKDTLIGNITLPKLKGQLDSNGKFISSWNYKDSQSEFIAEFDNNSLIKLIHRNTQDGVINLNYNLNNYINLVKPSLQKLEQYKLTDEYSSRDILAILPDSIQQREKKVRSVEHFFNRLNYNLKTYLSDLSFLDFNYVVVNPSVTILLKETVRSTNDEESQVYQAKLHKIESEKKEMQKKLDEKINIERRKQDSINDADVIYSSYGLDFKPKFNKNSDDFVKYIKSKLTTEDTSLLDGKFIAVSFIVEKNGILTDIKISKGINTEIDDKILKIISESPEWESGLKNGKKVRSSFQVLIRFKKNEH